MPEAHALEYRLICVSDSRGLQQYTARLANALSKAEKLQLSVAGQSQLLELIDDEIETAILPSRRRSLRTLAAIGRAIFTRRQRIIHYQGINLVTLILLAVAGRLGWRTVLTPHNVQTHFRNRAYNAIKWPLWRSYDMIVLHTKAELELIPNDLRRRVAIIPHGEYAPKEVTEPVSAEIIKAVADLGDFLLAPGFIRDDKNVDYLLNNASLIKRHELALVVAGRNQGSIPSEIIGNAATYFDGFLPDADLDYLIAHAKAVVLPYDKVSESGILHQALAVGTPVIASDIPGFRERLSEGKTGWFLTDLSPTALDSTLRKLRTSTIHRSEIARCHLAEFSWDVIASRLLEEIDARRIHHK